MSDHYDIAVIGAGAAGIAAAVTAARSGCTTLLLDRREAAGGTGGFSGLTTLCGLYDAEGEFLVTGFAAEFADRVSDSPALQMGRAWVLPYRPDKFREVTSEFIRETPNLNSMWGVSLAGLVKDGQRITGLNGLTVAAVIDCSGDAAVAQAASVNCLETTDTTQAPAVLFSVENIARELNT